MDKNSTCGSCLFYVSGSKKLEGACRRWPPKLFLLGMKPAQHQSDPPTPIHVSLWPGVGAGASCGEHRPRDAS